MQKEMRAYAVRKLLGVHRRTLSRLVSQKQLRWHRGADGKRAYDEVEVRRFMAQSPVYRRRLQRLEQYENDSYEDHFTTRQVAKMFGKTDQTVRSWIKRSGILAVPPEFQTGDAPQRWLTLTRPKVLALAEGFLDGPVHWIPDDEIILGTCAAARYLGVSYGDLDRLGLVPQYTEKGWRRYTKEQLRRFAVANPELCPLFCKSQKVEPTPPQVRILEEL